VATYRANTDKIIRQLWRPIGQTQIR
jgi:hypothetical protein